MRGCTTATAATRGPGSIHQYIIRYKFLMVELLESFDESPLSRKKSYRLFVVHPRLIIVSCCLGVVFSSVMNPCFVLSCGCFLIRDESLFRAVLGSAQIIMNVAHTAVNRNTTASFN